MLLFTATFTEPPVSISPVSSTFTLPPDSILPTFTFDHPDTNPYRPPSWFVWLMIGFSVILVFTVVIAFLQCCCSRRSLPQPPPVVLPHMPMTEIEMQPLLARP
ncbi:hypothetical protein A2U01_0030481 [Trifolium medium]|uniref:Uncharacterized protein n=1 Tax=Trifolium medium TaxID=97028 RepID=A0A392PEV0_9FABA|nr:hypothetical protein [Trifolium medium]